MESGYGMKPYLIGDTLRSARFWIQDSGAMRVADMICATKNGDGSPKLVIFQGLKTCRVGEWNKGGTCNTSREPETDYSKLEPEPPNNIMIYEATEQMKSVVRTVKFLNITYLTEFRRDGHPSSNREPNTPVDAPEDCSHWCLPGVPDTWNELLYAELLRMEYRTRMT
ncbi:UNVERIFIED_CONTAM: protein trichome birefringence-like 8 [Sesamum radiatum]|uniref:Protein trichome birefringence-like 8 n=1 Tax=Sesamum radiatum TaxID=300843 RepID=A0AAW2JQU7_SESRA